MAFEDEIINPNEHLPIPDWLSEEYFRPVLDKDVPNYVKILKFVPVAAIPPGENFTSAMFRIYIDLELNGGIQERKTYVLKTTLAEDMGGKIFDGFEMFPKEMEMYRTYLPGFEALYKAAGRSVQIAPKCLFTEERDDIINFVFEDLAVKKFQNIDRTKGLDMPHMIRILQKLAEYHAASAVYAEQNGAYPKVFNEGLPTKTVESFHYNAFQIKSTEFKQSMFSWGMENAEKYANNYPTVDQFMRLNETAVQVDPNDFNVLIHGDFWSSNIMSTYFPDGTIDQILLLDFQLCKWGSPAQDLLFFLILSAHKDLRIMEFDHFVEIYHEALIDCLKVLKYQKPLPKLRDLHIAMYKENNTFYAFFAVLTHLPLILFPTDKDSSVQNLHSKDEIGKNFRIRVYSNPIFANTMKELYPFFCRRGIFKFDA